MNIFCHVPREGWIVDRMGQEFKSVSSFNVSFNTIDKDTKLIWLLGSWCWNQIPEKVLEQKKVVCTIHHEVPWKFNEERKKNFIRRDRFVDYYLTYNEDTKKLINSLSKKPVKIIPHWINTVLWKELNKETERKKMGLPDNKFLIGSFQRDTEGHDLITPKLEKGPDVLIDKILNIARFKDVHVVLAGWRRQYVISELKKNKISYTYIELPSDEKINQLYNALDLYIVSSRCEGGPQAIFECAYLKTPIISTPVGQYKLLSDTCIYHEKETIDLERIEKSIQAVNLNFKNILSLLDTTHIKKYEEYFEEIIK